MKDKEVQTINKMIEYIDKVCDYTRGYTLDEFYNDTKTQDATIFNISQIGELIKNISIETQEKYKDIEWQMIKGLRNRIIHDYTGINLNNIWYIINFDLDILKEKLEKIIKEID